MAQATVCVMDASGELGLGLVVGLIQRGYTVHAVLQNHGNHVNKLKFDEIMNCCCDEGNNNKNIINKVKIFQSDPFDYQSIIDALRGCSALFYSFEPPQDQPDYDEFMADVEVRAAHNVLEACGQTDTIEKVIFSSSITAVVWRNDRTSMLSDLDERHWSDVNLCRNFKLWHGLSKTLAEKTAWALAMDRGVNMVSINAGLLMGPQLTINNPYLKGAAEMYEDGVFVTVDLDYLVDAHIAVLEDVSSYGRYLCFNHIINQTEDALQLARKLAPSTPSPPQSHEQDKRIIQEKISNKKLNKMMIDFEK
ncbi:hypothetical protein F8388_008486 [Cannabis sativa]|uniref:3-beta hydroxysteroid dehydrogenase/isomerase domain-containing protein n=1 Tax=Cannabis sativa TaxID=3483 RepID=A0A7J6EHS1_CANSA|nr:hypothetical protein F8388_008486 [Cannabis sativa]